MSEWGVVDIQGRPYYTVARRVHDFRSTCPLGSGWTIRTEILERDAEHVLARASIVDPEGRVISTGHAFEQKDDMDRFMATSMLEVAETSAVGRALAFAGLGGSQSEIASADEIGRRGTQEAEPMSAKKTRETIEALVTRATAEDFAGVLEVWEELSQPQMIWINRQMDRHNKKIVGVAIETGRARRDGTEDPNLMPPQPIEGREKDVSRAAQRAKS